LLPFLRLDEGLFVMPRRARIMVVHDERQAAEMLGDALEMMGYEAYAYADWLDAIEALGAGHDHDLLITDRMTPRAPGDQVVRWARALCMPVILVSRAATRPGQALPADAQLPHAFTLVDLELAVVQALSSGTPGH
jgi:CheY-like chemotaxis protein